MQIFHSLCLILFFDQNDRALRYYQRLPRVEARSGRSQGKRLLSPDSHTFRHLLGQLCLSKADQRTLLVNRLRAIMKQRLLHPGASTRDIITCYISSIRCLRLLDPQGVLLSRVADPIRVYLRYDKSRCCALLRVLKSL